MIGVSGLITKEVSMQMPSVGSAYSTYTLQYKERAKRNPQDICNYFLPQLGFTNGWGGSLPQDAIVLNTTQNDDGSKSQRYLCWEETSGLESSVAFFWYHLSESYDMDIREKLLPRVLGVENGWENYPGNTYIALPDRTIDVADNPKKIPEVLGLPDASAQKLCWDRASGLPYVLIGREENEIALVPYTIYGKRGDINPRFALVPKSQASMVARNFSEEFKGIMLRGSRSRKYHPFEDKADIRYRFSSSVSDVAYLHLWINTTKPHLDRNFAVFRQSEEGSYIVCKSFGAELKRYVEEKLVSEGRLHWELVPTPSYCWNQGDYENWKFQAFYQLNRPLCESLYNLPRSARAERDNWHSMHPVSSRGEDLRHAFAGLRMGDIHETGSNLAEGKGADNATQPPAACFIPGRGGESGEGRAEPMGETRIFGITVKRGLYVPGAAERIAERAGFGDNDRRDTMSRDFWGRESREATYTKEELIHRMHDNE